MEEQLKGRKMKCFYFGGKYRTGMVRGRCECDTCEHNGKGICQHILDSTEKSAFFKYRPEQEYDEFYCGCSGWD